MYTYIEAPNDSLICEAFFQAKQRGHMGSR